MCLNPADDPAFKLYTFAEDSADAARYRAIRRGQHWSVINGIGDVLRADELDAAIDNASKAEGAQP